MFLTTLWNKIKSLWTPAVVVTTATTAAGATVTTATPTPVEVADTDLATAITIVNNVKAALSSPVAVLITALIPGSVASTIREQLVNDLPALVAGLANIESYIDTADKSAQLNDILSQIKLSNNIDMNAFLHTLAARLLTKISGTGWSIAVMTVEYFFVNEYSSFMSGVKGLVADVTGKAPAAAPAVPATPAAVVATVAQTVAAVAPAAAQAAAPIVQTADEVANVANAVLGATGASQTVKTDVEDATNILGDINNAINQ